MNYFYKIYFLKKTSLSNIILNSETIFQFCYQKNISLFKDFF